MSFSHYVDTDWKISPTPGRTVMKFYVPQIMNPDNLYKPLTFSFFRGDGGSKVFQKYLSRQKQRCHFNCTKMTTMTINTVNASGLKVHYVRLFSLIARTSNTDASGK